MIYVRRRKSLASVEYGVRSDRGDQKSLFASLGLAVRKNLFFFMAFENMVNLTTDLRATLP
jgi:hypothetical protein